MRFCKNQNCLDRNECWRGKKPPLITRLFKKDQVEYVYFDVFGVGDCDHYLPVNEQQFPEVS